MTRSPSKQKFIITSTGLVLVMVSHPEILASNAQIPAFLPKQLVAVFAGATSGIGEVTLKTLVKYAIEPRIYLFARTQTSAERVIAECRKINQRGEYIFIGVDLSSVKETDRACELVKKSEKQVSLVVLSAGQITFGLTPEGLNSFLAASTYTRIRIVQQLLPLLITAASRATLARVVDVAAGTYEGYVNTSDLGALDAPLWKLRPHLSSMHTLAWESLADQAPTVSFVHNFPGSVPTNLYKNASGALGWVMRVIKAVVGLLFGYWLFIPIEDCGEREVYLATSGKYAPRKGSASGVPTEDIGATEGSDGFDRTGVYSVNFDGEKRTEGSLDALKTLRAKGVKEMVWHHVNNEFDRITNGAE